MEKNKCVDSVNQDLQEELPYLFQQITSNTVVGFDSSKESNTLNLDQPMATPETISSPNPSFAKETDSGGYPRSLTTQLNKNPTQGFDSHQSLCISISMPCSSVLNHEQTERVQFSEEGERNVNKTAESPANPSDGNFPKSEAVKFVSLPISSAPTYVEGDTGVNSMRPSDEHQRNLKNNRFKDKRFDSFKTWSGKLERQISHLVGIPPEPSTVADVSEEPQIEAVPVDRYYDALEGPELNLLRASEELVLPKDKLWPFLLRFPISSFGICLGIGSQAILWKALASSPSTRFLHVSPIVNYILWTIAICVMAVVSSIYILKVIFFFEAVRREYYHPIRVNFFFAPWIASLFLVLGLPPHIAEKPPTFLWFLLMAPILCLNLKIYGQWMSGGQRRLSKVANPSNHLAIIGNFVGALLGASMGLTDGPIFFFAIGLAHYTVLFVTLYQRLPTNETLPKELHPVFFLFVAAPSVASMAWANLQGKFDYASRISYFISLFLYVSLAVRVNFFRGFTFSLAWWAYTFPMTGASIATIKYANEVQNPITQSLLVILSAISTVIVTILLITTIIHAFVLRNLFPNDIVIAISRKKTKASKRHSHKRYSASVDANDIEATLGPADSNR